MGSEVSHGKGSYHILQKAEDPPAKVYVKRREFNGQECASWTLFSPRWRSRLLMPLNEALQNMRHSMMLILLEE